MSTTPGITPLTPDIEKVRHSEDDEKVIVDGGADDMFNDPEAEDEDIEELEDAEIERLEDHDGIEPGP